MTNNHRALALIRRESSDLNVYEAWLYHLPTIRSKSIGIHSTKYMLQYEADQSKEFPTKEITGSDIQDALATPGLEVMVYYLNKDDPVPEVSAKPKIEFLELDVQPSQGQAPSPVSPWPGILPWPNFPNRPGRHRQLPPILDPISNDPGKLQCLSMIDANYQNWLASVAPYVVFDQGAKEETVKAPPLDADTRQLYQEIADEFVIGCDHAALKLGIKS
jgi:hypothetical protein